MPNEPLTGVALANRVASLLDTSEWHDAAGTNGADPDPEAIRTLACGFVGPQSGRERIFMLTAYRDGSHGLVALHGDELRTIDADATTLAVLWVAACEGANCRAGLASVPS